jgi:glycine cleavage system H protein
VDLPDDLRYSKDHEWIRLEDGNVRVGITDYAQDALGDVVYIEVPTVDAVVTTAEKISEVESTKSVSDIYAPVAGTIVAVNEELNDAPELVNDEPYGGGWICVIAPSDPSEIDGLLDAGAYRSLVGE